MSAATTQDDHYSQALAALEQTLDRADRCTPEEKDKLRSELGGLKSMHDKLSRGRVEIVVFGEISTGKSALINALLGQERAAVDVRGGWTREVWHVPWDGCGYAVPGLADSEVVLVDTPGVNEVGGADRGDMAKEAAQRADLILFVTDSDLNDVEYAALLNLASLHKPLIVVLNKIDLYSKAQRDRLLDVLRNDRLKDILPPNLIVATCADPKEKEYVIQAADGSERSEWRKPKAELEDLKALILETLDREGLSLLAINAALYASDKSDRIVALRMQLRHQAAERTIWSYTVVKAVAVGANPIGYLDIVGGTAADAALVVTLAQVYGLEMSYKHAGELVWSIVKAAGWTTASVAATTFFAATVKAFTFGHATPFLAIPQGAAAGYGSYIVGQAARYYFEHGSSWGGESPKEAVSRILAQADEKSIMQSLKEEIRKKLLFNQHTRKD